MFKKVLIAAGAVLVGLLVVKGTWLGSHARMWASKARHSMDEMVPPEQEIARLRMEVQNLKRDDERHVDRVARLAVEVERMERDVAATRDNLRRSEAQLRQARKEIGGGDFAVVAGQRLTREELRAEALAFKAAEEALKSKEDALTAKRRVLTLEKKKLHELQTVRSQMSAELTQLEALLAQERHSQAACESCVDDSAYQNLRKDMDKVRERIEVLKKKRELRGEIRLPEVSDRQRQQNAEADRFLEARFGEDKKEVAGK